MVKRKRINKRKQRQRIFILLTSCIVVLVLLITSVVFLTRALFFTNSKQETTSKKEETEETTKLVATTTKQYKKYNVNESGNIPVMMYHGIHSEVTSDQTGYTGGNVDADGYQRTAEAFKQDLEMYYQKGYRMVRLTDYVDGNIDVEAGKSPLVLTFDDGFENNIRVIGEDKDGNIKIDPESAVGILESFKEKYPDYNVTATFFIEEAMFQQSEYNEKILKWLVENGYDVGNHTLTHVDFTTIDTATTEDQVGGVYALFDTIIPDQYVNIVALPYGSPYEYDHENMSHILDCTYNGKSYHTKSTLRVGWEADYSPFHVDFTSNFIKRIRAYDNNGEDFDIEYNFNILEDTRYISDGDENTIVVPETDKDLIGNTYDKKLVTYSL